MASSDPTAAPYTRSPNCRICGHSELAPVLSLGRQPLANKVLKTSVAVGPEPRVPLDVVHCPHCSLVQLTATVDPAHLFRHYLYFSSQAQTMLDHARDMVTDLTQELGLGPEHFVIEIASNDGYLLRNFVQRGIPALGIEPARNIAARAEALGVSTLAEFFDMGLARRLATEGRRADLIIANNVIAHVADLHGVMEGVRELLKPSGVAVFEFQYIGGLIETCAFDTIYHEHLCYFSATAFEYLLRQHGLAAWAITPQSTHGGSLRVHAVAAAGAPASPKAVKDFLAGERRAGIFDTSHYTGFAKRTDDIIRRSRELLLRLRGEGLRMAGYAAAAKCTVMLNALGLDADTVTPIADRSPYKQGHLIPGLRVPIVSPEAMLAQAPDVIVIFAWNIAAEIMESLDDYRRGGGRFLVLIPEPRLT
ncbi:MAG: class I SAM-dependent methyltransferase [Planctomycetes bacterium]|nr:class I SAM-dependent methyltransferase [Planctomycetota bacterium]